MKIKHTSVSSAAAILGRIGGAAGTGASKRRSNNFSATKQPERCICGHTQRTHEIGHMGTCSVDSCGCDGYVRRER